MPFEFKKVLEHGTTNPIVARLSLQILQILKQCNASEDLQAKVGDLYINSLQKKLLRCWEIEDRFKVIIPMERLPQLRTVGDVASNLVPLVNASTESGSLQ